MRQPTGENDGVFQAQTTGSREPFWIFARRKSATIPQAWLSRSPEFVAGVGIRAANQSEGGRCRRDI